MNTGEPHPPDILAWKRITPEIRLKATAPLVDRDCMPSVANDGVLSSEGEIDRRVDPAIRTDRIPKTAKVDINCLRETTFEVVPGGKGGVAALLQAHGCTYTELTVGAVNADRSVQIVGRTFLGKYLKCASNARDELHAASNSPGKPLLFCAIATAHTQELNFLEFDSVIWLQQRMSSCPFCSLDTTRTWIENGHAIAFADSNPVTDGHTLVIPRKHVSSIYELTADEQASIWDLVAVVRERLLVGLKPDGFNIGVNDGLAAGQTVEHAHVHLIPRREGDVPDPRGGIRWIVADHAKYWD
jgi:diadenosine tetraphosphate (Ap4A) HIT family hydrolase